MCLYTVVPTILNIRPKKVVQFVVAPQARWAWKIRFHTDRLTRYPRLKLSIFGLPMIVTLFSHIQDINKSVSVSFSMFLHKLVKNNCSTVLL